MGGYALTRDETERHERDEARDRYTLSIEDGGVIDELAIAYFAGSNGDAGRFLIHDAKRDAIVQVPAGALILLLKLAGFE